MDNIAEGFDDGSPNEFVRFLGYAQRSASEIQSQLYRALDCGYISRDQFESVYKAAASCRKQIKGFVDIYDPMAPSDNQEGRYV
jgi:four helix bundle protein